MYERGMALRVTGNAKAALEDYNTAIRLKPGVGLYYYERAKTHQVLGNIPQAKQDLQRAKEFNVKVDPAFEAELQ